MSGGGSGGSAPELKPVPQTQLQTTGYGGMGYTPTPQTYTPEAKPGWMTGAWDMPTWGMDAVTGQPLTQQQLMAPAYQQPTQMMQPQTPAPQQQPQMGMYIDQWGNLTYGPIGGDTGIINGSQMGYPYFGVPTVGMQF